MKYTKKPVEVDAIQWNKIGDDPDVTPIPLSVLEREMKEGVFASQRGFHPDVCGWIGTLEGGHIVSPGDFIITGVKGERYPCKPDIFKQTYSPADPSQPLPTVQGEKKDEESFQERVDKWLLACFGENIARNKQERNHRFIEEALELVQSCGITKSECSQLVDYVFGREIGEPKQEIGGVIVTLAALCCAHNINMSECGETELSRIWTKIEKIRIKQANKPKHSPLPQSQQPFPNPTVLIDALNKAVEVIKIWHNMDPHNWLTEEQNERAWNIYYEKAPEMKPIREALQSYPSSTTESQDELATQIVSAMTGLSLFENRKQFILDNYIIAKR